MRPSFSHPWNVDLEEARALQQALRGRVETEDRFEAVRRVAGVDVSYDKGSTRRYAAVVVLDFDTLETIEVSGAAVDVDFPYVPGLLSFREIPPLIRAFERLAEPPDLVVADGHGIAHPRRFGIACHLGVLFDVPAIGCAKKLLAGRVEGLGEGRGSTAPIVHGGEVIGEAVRTRDGVQPVYVSPGHRVSQPSATAFVLHLTRGYRLPETTRAAHDEVNRLRRAGAA